MDSSGELSGVSSELRALLRQRLQMSEGRGGAQQANMRATLPSRLAHPLGQQAAAGARPQPTQLQRRPWMVPPPAAGGQEGLSSRDFPGLPPRTSSGGRLIATATPLSHDRPTSTWETRVSNLAMRNEMISQEVERMKERLVEGDGSAVSWSRGPSSGSERFVDKDVESLNLQARETQAKTTSPASAAKTASPTASAGSPAGARAAPPSPLARRCSSPSRLPGRPISAEVLSAEVLSAEVLPAESNDLLAETEQLAQQGLELDRRREQLQLEEARLASQRQELADQKAKVESEARELESSKAEMQELRTSLATAQQAFQAQQALQEMANARPSPEGAGSQDGRAADRGSPAPLSGSPEVESPKDALPYLLRLEDGLARAADFFTPRSRPTKPQASAEDAGGGRRPPLAEEPAPPAPASPDPGPAGQHPAHPEPEAPQHTSNEARLRTALTNPAATSAELRQAIGAVEALLDEARRELANKLFRERRAAFEKLHHAIDKGGAAELEEAIAAARAAEVDLEDIEKAEAKLEVLNSLTEEERAAIAGREMESKRKKEAFMLVKKDNDAALVEFLDGLEAAVRWQDWRDYAGRSLRRCAQELRANRAEKVLAERLAPQVQQHSLRANIGSAARQSRQPDAPRPAEAGPAAASSEARAPPPSAAKVASSSPRAADEAGAGGGDAAAPTSEEGAEKLPLTADEEERQKAKALRAVVQDDCEALSEVLERVENDMWSRWENKAGKDLLTLSQERGSTAAYAQLAKALGMVQEMKRDTYEERETVWIFLPGEVQPLRATVLEDTPEEADEVFIEYWDGDAPPQRVDRAMVRPMWS